MTINCNVVDLSVNLFSDEKNPHIAARYHEWIVRWGAGKIGAINNGGFDRFSTSSNDINQLVRLKIRVDQYWRCRGEKKSRRSGMINVIQA